MPDNDAAVKAILALNGKALDGRRIRLAPSTRIK
jgi:RNA recognition motif-containing protein